MNTCDTQGIKQEDPTMGSRAGQEPQLLAIVSHAGTML